MSNSLDALASLEAFPDLHPSIPRVLCPRCGTHMRLAELLTDLADHETIYFDCSCGFEYRMSARARS
jgi:RNase P subunit RPR2